MKIMEFEYTVSKLLTDGLGFWPALLTLVLGYLHCMIKKNVIYYTLFVQNV